MYEYDSKQLKNQNKQSYMKRNNEYTSQLPQIQFKKSDISHTTFFDNKECKLEKKATSHNNLSIMQFAFGEDGKFLGGDRGDSNIIFTPVNDTVQRPNAARGPGLPLAAGVLWQHGAARPVRHPQAAYHHVIPLQLLREFWNKLVDTNKKTTLSQISDGVLRGQLNLRDQEARLPLANRDDTIATVNAITNGAITNGNITNGAITNGNTTINSTNSAKNTDKIKKILNKEHIVNSAEFREILSSAYLWLPGNIVIGPGNDRANDTHNGMELDKEAASAKGGALSEKKSKLLFNRITNVINGEKADLEYIQLNIVALSSVHVRRPEWRLNAALKWEIVPGT